MRHSGLKPFIGIKLSFWARIKGLYADAVFYCPSNFLTVTKGYSINRVI